MSQEGFSSPPRGNFLHYFFLKPQCLLSIFSLFCNLATGAFEFMGKLFFQLLKNLVVRGRVSFQDGKVLKWSQSALLATAVG